MRTSHWGNGFTGSACGDSQLPSSLPNLRHFKERQAHVKAYEAAREKIRARSWRFDR